MHSSLWEEGALHKMFLFVIGKGKHCVVQQNEIMLRPMHWISPNQMPENGFMDNLCVIVKI
jgi:hypothetical protein